MTRSRPVSTRASRSMAFIAILALLLGAVGPVSADDVIEVQAGTPEAQAGDPGEAEAISSWFVELDGAPTVDGGSVLGGEAEKKRFRDEASRRRISYQERYAYSDLFNGFSISAAGDALARLRSIPGVRAIWPVVTESLPKGAAGAGEVIDLSTALQMTGAAYAQDTLGLTGKNVKVAVMDTGVDYDHPDLGGCFKSSRGDDGDADAHDGGKCRVIKGWDFVGDAFNADPSSPGYNPVPVPDSDPDDCNGHGTHVAGIIGASGAVTGVAPRVKFGAYRVFGCAGSTTSDIMLAAMERALHDNMDVLNMSIGSSLQWPQYPTAAAADRLVTKKGMVVVASIGNSGPGSSAPLGLYAAGAPGVGSKVIGVASFDNTHNTLRVFTASPGGAQYGYNQAAGAPVAPTSGSLPLARTGTPASTADACTALPAGSLAGKAALIRRGTCTFFTKANNARNAGAAAVVIYNNAAGIQSITVAGSPAITIPVVSISDVQGLALDALIAAGPATLTWTTGSGKFPSVTGNSVSGFSSYGLAADLTLKPDLGAPGGSIYSTLPLENGAYGNLSGTSMSSPHVAGLAALYLERHGVKDPARMRDILQNTASPRKLLGSTFLDSVNRQGAGMADIRAALEANAVVTPGKLSLGEQSGPATRTLTVENTSKDDQTYTLSFESALATGPGPFSISLFSAPSAVSFSATTVTVKKNKSATVDVTIAPNAGLADRSIFGGWIVLSSTTDDSVLRVPYAGFKGDYQSIVVANLSTRRHVCRQVSPGSFSLTGGTFTFSGATETPSFCVHFDHQSRQVDFLVKDSGGATVGTAFSLPYFTRNSSSTGFFAFPWDGVVTSGGAATTLPNGTYTIELRILKALGDPADPAHTEIYTLAGSVTIARP